VNIGYISALIGFSLLLSACGSVDTQNSELSSANGLAAITNVTTTGDSGSYNFSVTIRSPDTGCEQYADWWEVLRPDGSLLYRRILTHSHINEQPFTRSGGPVNVSSDEEVIVRAHMNSVGYGQQVFKGRIESGLAVATLDTLFADELEIADPLPITCDF